MIMEMKRILSFIVIFTFFIFLSLSSQALANGVLLESVGPISTGRGATNIAHADNGSMVRDNPAGLANITSDKIELNADLFSFSMHYQDPQNNDEEGKEPIFTLPSFFYTKRLNKTPLGIGVGVFNSAGYSTEYNLIHPNYGTQKYFSYSSLSKILMGAGYKFGDRFSLGLGMGASYSQVKLELPYTFQTGALKGIPALINMKGDDWTYTWNLGAQWQIFSKTTLGLAYRSQDTFNMHGDLDMDIPALAQTGPDTTAHYDLDFDFRWPRSLGLGLLHRLTDKHTLSFDVMWIDWSSAFDDLTLKLSNGDNAAFNSQTGKNPQDTLPLDWKDGYSFRLGYEQLLTPGDTLRFGYLYSQSPVPDSTLVPMIPGILTHMLSVGYSREWKNWSFNLAYLYAFPSKQSVGTSKIVGGDFDSSSLKQSLHCLCLGVGYRI